jgi:hypothetical protein
MKHSTSLAAVLGLAISMVVAEFTVIPGKEAISYCSSNPVPNADNCRKALAKIDDNGDYGEGAEYQAGDCTIAMENTRLNLPLIKGSDFKYMASAIIELGCQADGWGIVGQQNVTVHLCKVCMYGVCTTCNAPARRSGATLPEFETVEERRSQAGPTTPDELAAMQAVAALRARDGTGTDPNHPEPDLYCERALGPVKTADCMQIADSIRGKTLNLPYLAGAQGCNMALWSTWRGMTASGDVVADRIQHDMDVCSQGTGGVVGHVVDTSKMFVGLAPGVKIWVGQLCQEFGIGVADCTQGEAPGR